MQFKQSSLRAGPHVRTKWGVFQVGSPPRIAFLEVLSDTPEGVRYGHLLLTIIHQNVLHRLVPDPGPPFEEDGQKWYPIFVTCIEGTLYDFCGPESSCLVGVGNLMPSSLLVEIARNIIDGLSFVHEKGEYHGNISIGTMFYYGYEDGEICVTVYNLLTLAIKAKCFPDSLIFCNILEIPLKEAQRDDWRDFGKMLLDIEQEVLAYKSCHTSILVDFANLFINTAEEDLGTIKQKAYKHTFFSDTRDRRHMSYRVSPMLNELQFCELLRENSSKICSLPWGCVDYYALLPAVNQCRQMDFGQEPYEEKDFTDVVKFVGFICDMYEYCLGIDMPEGGTKYTIAQMDEFIISNTHACITNFGN